MDAKKEKLLCGAGILLVLVLSGLYLVISRSMQEKDVVELMSRGQEIPAGEHTVVDQDKVAGYQNGDNRRRVSANAMWDDLQAQIDEEGMPVSDTVSQDAGIARQEHYSTPNIDQLRADLLTSPDSEPARQPSRKSSGGGGSSRMKPMTQKERDDKVRHDYELATEIAQRIYGSDQGAADIPATTGSDSQTDDEQTRIDIPPSRPSSSSIVGGGWDGDGGMSSLDAEVRFDDDEDRPHRCMFTREEKIKDGQRVTLRLLEDMVIGGNVIPANSHITAVCSVKERLLVSVTSFEVNGRIYSLDMEGYDMDGALGIYCPGGNTDVGRTARNDAMALGQNVARGSVGAIASSVLRTGASIVRSATSEVSVSVPAGYTFYIIKKKKR